MNQIIDLFEAGMTKTAAAAMESYMLMPRVETIHMYAFNSLRDLINIRAKYKVIPISVRDGRDVRGYNWPGV
jgi:hypothetical protein